MTTRDTVRVEGPEAAAYLQGQISQDVDAVGVGDTAWSLVLAPDGKVEAWFRIHRSADDEFLLDVDAGHRDALIARLERFKLRTDATITATDDTIPAPIEWPGLDDPGDERARILAGFPRMGAELTPATIPAEAGATLIERSVSFTKGCYTGQELVARIDSRGGNVPRPVRLLVAERGSAPLEVGADVLSDGDVVGVVTSAAGDVALATVQRKVEIGATVEIGAATARLSEPGGS